MLVPPRGIRALYGTYVFCQDYPEMEEVRKRNEALKQNLKNLGAPEKNEKNYNPSKNQRIQRGMQIFLCYHLFEVV